MPTTSLEYYHSVQKHNAHEVERRRLYSLHYYRQNADRINERKRERRKMGLIPRRSYVVQPQPLFVPLNERTHFTQNVTDILATLSNLLRHNLA